MNATQSCIKDRELTAIADLLDHFKKYRPILRNLSVFTGDEFCSPLGDVLKADDKLSVSGT